MARLPTYIIAGAIRSGTTALNSYLREHPDVAVSSTKEVYFFDAFFDRGSSGTDNSSRGSESAAAVGEATPNYMFSTTALDRIRATVPDVKLVVMLRNPIDRAYSHYWHDRARGKTEGDFEENVMRELDGGEQGLSYIARGRYRTQIESILERFPPTALHIEVFEDMVDRPDGFYSSVCQFIGSRRHLSARKPRSTREQLRRVPITGLAPRLAKTPGPPKWGVRANQHKEKEVGPANDREDPGTAHDGIRGGQPGARQDRW